jgi:hypothetical protein
VLHGFGENSIVASICPKLTDAAQVQSAEYGYNPAVAAIVDRLKERLAEPCLPRPLAVEGGQVKCKIVEASYDPAATCDATTGREAVDAALTESVRRRLAEEGQCGTPQRPTPCDAMRLCGLTQLKGTEQAECMTQEVDGSASGWCYIDAEKLSAFGLGDENKAAASRLVSKCPATQRRKLHFQGKAKPRKGTVTFYACSGQAF